MLLFLLANSLRFYWKSLWCWIGCSFSASVLPYAPPHGRWILQSWLRKSQLTSFSNNFYLAKLGASQPHYLQNQNSKGTIAHTCRCIPGTERTTPASNVLSAKNSSSGVFSVFCCCCCKPERLFLFENCAACLILKTVELRIREFAYFLRNCCTIL